MARLLVLTTYVRIDEGLDAEREADVRYALRAEQKVAAERIDAILPEAAVVTTTITERPS